MTDAADSGDWATMTLGELVDLRLSSVDKKSKPGETPVLLCNYTDVYRNRIIHSDLDFMEATATDREIEKCALQPGDVVITKDSEQYDDIGVPALIRDDAPALVCGYHLAILRPRHDLIDGAYLFNALTTREVQHQFHAFANGVTRFGLRKADIERVRIPVPAVGEQRRIARVLGVLDDKIELNRRMAETLEEMARALFRSWFVDFEPVRAKQEGRWRRGQSLPGLPAHLYEAFPERLEPSELGPIPAGWRVASLGELCHKPQYGYTASAEEEPVGPKFLRIKDINKSSWIDWSTVPHCTISDDDIARYRLREGDIVIARMADPGHGVLIEEDRSAVFASYLIRFRPLDQAYARFLQYWLRSDAYWALVAGRRTGTTRANLNAKTLAGFPLVSPPRDIAASFGEVITCLRASVVAGAAQSCTMALTRDRLSWQLIGGAEGQAGAKQSAPTTTRRGPRPSTRRS